MAASADFGVVTVARLIDADALIQNHGNDVTNWDNPYAVKISSIEHAPTVDAVEVVRCRDCKHRGTDYCIFHIKGEPADEELLGKLDNDFCSYGERKDNV